VWTRESGGLVLTFHLAGINNQNFLMRDDQTGSYWQQITGEAVSGPLRGRRLTLVASDELSFGLWAAEEPGGTVLKSVPKYASDYEKKDWEVRMKKARTVLSFADPARGLEPRTLLLGVQAFGASRAFPYDAVIQEKLVLDRVERTRFCWWWVPMENRCASIATAYPASAATRPSTAPSMTSSLIRMIPRG